MNCLYCASEQIVMAAFPRPTLFNGKLFSYKRCLNCGLIFIDPIPGPEDYNVMYSNEYHNQFYFKDIDPDFTPLLELLEKHVKSKLLVDYGCGDGSFVRFFSKRGYQCTGVEYDKELVKQLKEKNPGIKFYDVDEFWDQPQNNYGVIYMGDVLEHLSEPRTFLDKLKTKLTEGGLVMAQGPLENHNNLALKVRKLISAGVSLAGKRTASHVPYHISFANADNQENLFRSRGFKTLEYKVYETPWPYPSAFKMKPLAAFQYIVARTSIIFSKLLPGKNGNRFIFIGEKNSD